MKSDIIRKDIGFCISVVDNIYADINIAIMWILLWECEENNSQRLYFDGRQFKNNGFRKLSFFQHRTNLRKYYVNVINQTILEVKDI